MSLGFILLIVLIVVLIGSVGPGFYSGTPWPYGFGGGHYAVGGVGLILLILLVLLLLGRI